MKKLPCILILFLMFSQLTYASESEDNIAVFAIGNQKAVINGSVRTMYPDDPAIFPFLLNDRALLPLRAVGEIFNAEVDWDAQTQTATVTKSGHTAKVTLNNKTLLINGEEVPIDTKAIIIYGRCFLPLRVIAEQILDKNVEYAENKEAGLRVVMISDRPKTDAQLNEISAAACQQIINARNPEKNGLDENGYYYINGRAYPIKGYAEKRQEDICTDEKCPLYNKNIKIPLISFNWLLFSDARIASMMQQDIMSLMEPVTVKGLKATLYVRKEVADEVKLIMEEIIDTGYNIYEIGCQRFGTQDFTSAGTARSNGSEEGSMWARFHPNGLAIDINWSDNPILYSGSSSYTSEKEIRSKITNPIDPAFHFNNHAVVDIFSSHGWKWGIWRNTSDYMHFSMGEY